jgi:hypothetical protein
VFKIEKGATWQLKVRGERKYLASILPRMLFAGFQSGPRTEQWLRLAEDQR